MRKGTNFLGQTEFGELLDGLGKDRIEMFTKECSMVSVLQALDELLTTGRGVCPLGRGGPGWHGPSGMKRTDVLILF